MPHADKTTPRLGSSITALVTPFTSDNQVDLDAYEKLMIWQAQSGIDAVVCCGSTGESPTVTTNEKHAIFERAAAVGKRIGLKVIANIGSNDTRSSCELAAYAENLGFDGLMAVVPYYNKPPQAALIKHYQAIASFAPNTTLMLYNVPGRSVIDMANETIIELVRSCDTIRALKQAAVHVESDVLLLEALSDIADFHLYAGNDDQIVNLMEIGASGVVTTVGNVAPRRLSELVRAAYAHDLTQARELEAALLPLINELFLTTNPIMVKAALNELGHAVGTLRLPLIDATDEQIEHLRSVMELSAPVE